MQCRRLTLGASQTLSPRDLIEGQPPGVGMNHNSDWRIKVSLIYRTSNTGRLKDLLRSIFVG